MKSADEILQIYLEPIVKKLQQLQTLIEAEEDFASNHDKQSQFKMIGTWLEDFEETRDGSFESHDENLIEVEVSPDCKLEVEEDEDGWNIGFEQAENDQDEIGDEDESDDTTTT